MGKQWSEKKTFTGFKMYLKHSLQANRKSRLCAYSLPSVKFTDY